MSHLAPSPRRRAGSGSRLGRVVPALCAALALLLAATPAVAGASTRHHKPPAKHKHHGAKHKHKHHKHRKHRPKHHKPKPKPKPNPHWTIDPKSHALTLNGPGTVITPGVGLGSIQVNANQPTPQQIIDMFGEPPKYADKEAPYADPIVRLDGSIMKLNYLGPNPDRDAAGDYGPSTGYWGGTGVTFEFGVGELPNTLREIQVTSPSYSTPQGVRIGSSNRDSVQAAYGGAPQGYNCFTVSTCGLGDISVNFQFGGLGDGDWLSSISVDKPVG